MTKEIQNRLALGLSFWDYKASVAHSPDGTRRRIPGAYAAWILRGGDEPANARTLSDDDLPDLPVIDDDDNDDDADGLLASRSASAKATELRARQAKLGDGFDPWPAHRTARPTRALAFHEAGHAVAGALLGFRIGPAVCDSPQRGKCGGTSLAWSIVDLSSGTLGNRLCVIAAGAAAERLLGGGRGEHDGGDLADARVMLAEKFGDADSREARECWRWAQSNAAGLVSRHRLAVGIVADQLMRAGRVTGEYVTTTLRSL